MEVVVHSIVRDVNDVPVVILREKDGDRMLPIWVGGVEAVAISLASERKMAPRPLTHETLYRTIQGLDGKVEKVVINKLQADVFYARMIITRGNQIISIDIRPSDAMAVALLAGAPIYVDENVLKEGKLT